MNLVKSISSTFPNSEKSILGITGIPAEEPSSFDLTNLEVFFEILFLGPVAITLFKSIPNSRANFLTAGPAYIPDTVDSYFSSSTISSAFFSSIISSASA